MITTRLGDALEQLIDHRGRTPKKLRAEFTDQGVPVLSAIAVKNGTIDTSRSRFVSETTFRRWMTVQMHRGDVILTSEAPLGRVARITSDEPVVLGQRLFGLRGKSGLLDNGYLYFLLQTSQIQADLVGRSTGTTVTGIRQSALRDIMLRLPGIQEQMAVAGVLGALDDKIATNIAVAGSARSLAEAHLEACTSDEHTLTTVGAILELRYGKALPLAARRSGDVAVVGSGGIVGWHDERLVDGPCVVVGRKGSVGTTYWIPGPAFPIDTTYYVEPGDGVPLIYCYFALRALDLARMNSDSAVPGLNRTEALALPIRVPAEAAMAQATEKSKNLMQLADQHDAESQTLAELRDTLLPALMSGRLRVKGAERQVEDAV